MSTALRDAETPTHRSAGNPAKFVVWANSKITVATRSQLSDDNFDMALCLMPSERIWLFSRSQYRWLCTPRRKYYDRLEPALSGH